jgi:hypothetical protein
VGDGRALLGEEMHVRIVVERLRGHHVGRQYLLDHFSPGPRSPAAYQAASEKRSPSSRAPTAKSLIRSAFSTILSSPAPFETATSHS